MRPAWASPEVVSTILDLGSRFLEQEICGLVMPDQSVVRLKNIAEDPTRAYEMEGLVEAILTWAEGLTLDDQDELTPSHFIIWHTHPGGMVGPSSGDMRNKLPEFQYMVVTLPVGPASMF